MNLNILLTILFTSSLFFILKLYRKYDIDHFHAIVVNYFMAATCSFIQGFQNNLAHLQECGRFIHITLITGILFIFVFMLTAKITRDYGVGVASIASKLSMVIPIFSGIYLYNESISTLKVTGLLLAVAAVLLVNLQDSGHAATQKNSFTLPLLLFAGCGVVDTSIKFTQHHFISDANRQVFIMCMFGCAGVIGLAKLIYDRITYNRVVNLKSIVGGIILGISNYFSLYFLVRSFEFNGAESSKVFALVNLGVVITCAFIAILFFKESVNKYKISGVILSLAAILALFYA